MKVFVLGGFLGAGKTTAIKALAGLLSERGERVAIVTNDQGYALVDTAAAKDSIEEVQEIGGGCFCCRYQELEDGLLAASRKGATVALAEAVGSCTDLVATVLSPLSERGIANLQVSPLSVLVNPYRAHDVASGKLPPDVCYLFEKQIEEADLVVLTRADQDPPDVRSFIEAISPGVSVVSISAATGEGVSRWLSTEPTRLAAPLDIDYDRYAKAEAMLGWANGRVTIELAKPDSPALLVKRFFSAMNDAPVAHLKVRVEEPGVGFANLVREGQPPLFDLGDLPEETAALKMLVNARVALPPEELRTKLEEAVQAACLDGHIKWTKFESFQPGRPVPTHRYTERCDPYGDASCCAAFYQSPTVQYLLGSSYHPGGTKLTLQMAEMMNLKNGVRVLDVACGEGTSLKAVLGRYEAATAVGMDVAHVERQDQDRITFQQGDAHRISFEEEDFDALLCECALSTFANQKRALAEMYRVLKPGGRLGITDMVANGKVPDSLAEWVSVGTCLSHARSMDDYGALLEEAGFRIVARENVSWALADLLMDIKRKLLTAAIAKVTGALPEGVDIDVKKGKEAVREGQAVVREGVVGYGLLVAEKPGA